MPQMDNCCAVASKMVTLTETLELTEKQIYRLAELVDAIDYKLNGPRPAAESCGHPDYVGVYDLANHNQAMLNNLDAQLSRIAERL